MSSLYILIPGKVKIIYDHDFHCFKDIKYYQVEYRLYIIYLYKINRE
jgi:hypothetical protein